MSNDTAKQITWHTITKDNIHIENSYNITKESYIKKYITDIKDSVENYRINCIVFQKRTIKSLTREWIAHNVLYKLHIARSHTKSVDLNIEHWCIILGYNIIYWVSRIFM